jgi:glycosyltransferase involved in cell wall biosynthesis
LRRLPGNDAPLLIDATRLVWRRWKGYQPTGIDRVCLAYLERFGGDAQAVLHHRWFRGILDCDASAALFELLADGQANFRERFLLGAARNLARQSLKGEGRPYLNLGHTGLDSEGFRNWVAQADVRPIYFVHDLIPLTHPEFCRPGESERHERRMRAVLETASGIIANSQATLDDLGDFALKQGLEVPPAIAAWLGAASFRLLQQAKADGPPTFLVLGTIEGRKNHLLLLNIWRRLVLEMAEPPRLLVVGQRGWQAQDMFDLLDRDPLLRGHVFEVNRCSDAELAAHFSSSRALLFPSKAEGYGLPLVEAMGAGLPVIASDLPVFREIGNGIPLLLDPDDEAAWEAAILDFARPESAARAAQLAKLQGYRMPDWDSHFATVEKWLSALG